MTEFTSAPFQPFYFPPQSIPLLPTLNLSDDEMALLSTLQGKADLYYGQMLLADSYYRGMQAITDLGIAIPKELQGLRTIVGWPRMAIDPIVDRLSLDGFRMPGQTDSDEDLVAVWEQNNMASEQALSFTDALVMGRTYLTVGSSMDAGGLPVIRAESPLNVSVLWDARTMSPSAALQSYWVDESRHAAIYLPDQTIHIAQNNSSDWVVTDRDMHNFGRVPVVRIANSPRANARDGFSEITPEIMSLTDAACRTMLGLEVARELYSVPQKIILGASEADFQGPDGSTKKAWDTYISHVIAIERDDEGNLPQIAHATPYDPTVYTKLIEMYASQMAGILGAPPQDLGLYTQGNPVSAEAGQVAEKRRNTRTRAKQSLFGDGLREVAKLALMFMNGGTLPPAATRLQVDWSDPEISSLAQTSDAIFKQISSGAIPATSDVTLKKLGYTAIERERLAQDRDLDQGASFLEEIAHSLTAKVARVDKSLVGDASAPAPAPAAAAVPTPKDVFGAKPTK